MNFFHTPPLARDSYFALASLSPETSESQVRRATFRAAMFDLELEWTEEGGGKGRREDINDALHCISGNERMSNQNKFS